MRLLVSFDLHFEVLQVARHTVGPHDLHSDGSPNKQQLWKFGLFVGGEMQNHCMPFDFHSPIMCMVVIFRESSPVAILAADSKRSFWAAWTVMKNCRSQFAWPRAQLKESAIRRVVERQVVYNSWTTGPGADSASGAGVPSEFRLRPLWWLRKKSLGFYSSRPPHCPVNASSPVFLQHRRHTGADVRMHHNNVEQDTI